MSFTPYTLSYDATADELAAIRAHLGISASEQSGRLSNDEGVIDWRVVPSGFEVTVDQLHGYLASHMPQSVIRAKIASQIGLQD